MKRLLIPCLILAAGMSTVACTLEEKEQTGSHDQDIIVDSDNVIPGMVTMKVSESMAQALEARTDTKGRVLTVGVRSSDDILSGINISYMRRTFPPAGKFEERTRREGLHRWYNVYFDESVAVTRATRSISDIEGVEYVESRPKIRRSAYYRPTEQQIRQMEKMAREAAAEEDPGISALFNDPYVGEQWHYYNNVTNPDLFKKAGSDINVLPAWKKGHVGSENVIVAVVDGGIDHEHDDLADNIWVNEEELYGLPAFDDDGNGFVDDIYGYNFVYFSGYIEPDHHGTHVAGTIGAVNNNGIGVCGIAGGNKGKGIKGVKLMSSEIFAGDYGGDQMAAIKYAADNGAVICQNSWGYSEELPSIPEADKEAIDYFVKYAGCDNDGRQVGPMKGGIVIFAAGNESRTNSYPAGYDKVVAVASIGADYEIAYYSNYGPWVDVSAPGGDANKSNYVCSTDIDNSYTYMQGTSMACPHVSGIVALIVSKHQGPGFTPKDARELLEENTTPIDSYNPYYAEMMGSGLVNAQASLAAIGKMPPDPITDLTAEGVGGNIRIRFTIPKDEDNIRVSKYNIYFSSTEFTKDFDVDILPKEINLLTIGAGNQSVGETFEYLLRNDDILPSSEYYVAVAAVDRNENLSPVSDVVRVRTEENHVPYFDPSEDIHLTLGRVENQTLKIKVTDPDGDLYSFRMDTDESGVISYQDNKDGSYDILFDASRSTDGEHFEALFTVTDAFGAKAELKAFLTVENYYIPDMLYDFSAKVYGREIRIKFTVPKDEDDGQPDSYNIYYSRTEFDRTMDVSDLPADVKVVNVENGLASYGDLFEYTLEGEDITFSSEYYVAGTSLDKELHESPLSNVIYVEIDKNHAPYFQPKGDINEVLEPMERKTVQIKAFDPDYNPYEVTVDSDNQVISAQLKSDGMVDIVLDAAKGEPGEIYEAKLKIEDCYGLSSSLKVKVLLNRNNPPTVFNPIADQLFERIGEVKTIDLSQVFNDVDHDELTYSVSVKPEQVLSAKVEGNLLRMEALKGGSAMVTVKAQDVLGDAVETSFEVKVKMEGSGELDLSVNPNPVMDFADIIVTEDISGGKIKIYNSVGAVVFKKENVDLASYEPFRVDMRGFGSGVYEVKVFHKGGVLSKSIVKL